MTTSDRHRRAERELSPADETLTALEITHPDVPEPVRVVDHPVDQVLGGNAYVGLRFEFRLAGDVEGRAPRAELAIDNVGRPLTQWIERSGGGAGATVKATEWLAADTAAPEWEVDFDLSDVVVRQSRVTATIGYENLFGRRAVALRHDPETSPGLF